MKTRTKEEINEKISKGEAKVLTAEELKDMIKNSEKPSFDDVDVVTTGTCGIMSGTAAILHIPIAEGLLFKKASKIYLNGVEGHVGPCPNEWLGSVDLIIHGTEHSKLNPEYGGGFLFKDLIMGNEIEVEVESIDGEKFSNTVTIDDIPNAEMIGTRNAFKNYSSFTNPDDEDGITSIFAQPAMKGNLKEFTFSGCGELNPLENDPNQEVIKRGTKVLLNGAEGLVLGNGTRSNAENPNLMLAADIKLMNKKYLGGFKTSSGPEVFDSVAVPIPILNENILKNTFILDKDVSLPVKHIKGRHMAVGEIDYHQVWDESNEERPIFNQNTCLDCEDCDVEKYCPTNAFKNKEINELECFGCGVCQNVCIGESFKIKTGKINLDINSKDTEIPIVCRQSDRKRAKSLANELKEKILNQEFKL